MNPYEPRYTLGEEIMNSITHAVGIVLSIAGLGVLTAFSALHGNAWHIVSCTIFAVTLILTYTTSTLYHSIQLPKVKQILRILDHSAIFLLIAGTYTPFTLVSLRGPLGWSLFALVWSLALLGIVFQCVLIRRFRFFICCPLPGHGLDCHRGCQTTDQCTFKRRADLIALRWLRV